MNITNGRTKFPLKKMAYFKSFFNKRWPISQLTPKQAGYNEENPTTTETMDILDTLVFAIKKYW